MKPYTEGYPERLRRAADPRGNRYPALGRQADDAGMRHRVSWLITCNGDIYFHVSREGHNLERARTQMKLVADMEDKWDRMNAIVQEAAQKVR